MKNSETMVDTADQMTFHPSDAQAELVELVAAILDKQSSDEQVAAIDSEDGTWNEELYSSLAEAGVLAAVLDDEDGLGMVGLGLVLVEAGARLARIPLAGSAVCALSLAAAGLSDEVEAIVAGELTVAPALPSRLHSVCVVDGQLRGSVGIVPGGRSVGSFLVAADDDSLWLVPGDHAGTRISATGFSYDNQAAVTFDVPTADCVRLDDIDRRHLETRWRIALSALAVGACREAVNRTAKYTSEREQFGKPLSSKQAVLHRAADAYIDTECIRLTTMNAAGMIDAGDDGADRAGLEAAWWTATAGSRVVHASQHLHGGMGADLDNNIHRFFVFVRELGIILGAADSLLDNLGGEIVAHAREERS